MSRHISKKAVDRKYIAYVVPETHWDRAWYLPFEEFRMKLVTMFDKLLEVLRTNPRFTAFSFDGQTVVLEDYLRIRPEKEKAIRKHVKEGRLAVGPWYILPDEYLVSGESTIRNLLIGHSIARDFGKVMKVGYIPDPFGHVSQIPQILRGFGIDSVLFSRGSGRNVRDAGLVFKWVGGDGRSWLYALMQTRMYVNLGWWGVPEGQPIDTPDVDYDKALRQVEELIDAMETWKNPTKILLFNNGCDHAPVQGKVPELIQHVNKNQERAVLVQGTFEDFVDALRKDAGPLASVRGELHEGMEVILLSGIFSARMYMKQANAAAQTQLEKLTEPLAAFSWSLGGEYPEAFLLHAWKELLKCHPHDDIGGCSVDAVHEEDMERFGRVQQIGRTLAGEALDHISSQIHTDAGKGVMVYNPLSFTNTGEVKLSIPLQKKDLPPNPRLLDPAGATIPAALKWSPRPENRPPEERSDLGSLDVAFLAEDLPSCGYRFYALAGGKGNVQVEKVDSRGKFIENEFFEIRANPDGTLNLKDKETAVTIRGLNFFEDLEDTGDEYDYSPLPAGQSLRITSQGLRARVSVMKSAPYKQSIEVSLTLRVPQRLTNDRTARSRQMVSLPIRSTVTLFRGVHRVDFETTVYNRALDHRLRAGFPTGIRTKVAYADSKFDVVERPLRWPKYTEKYSQPPVPTKHVETFVDVHDGKRGFALLNRGLPEYEAKEEPKGVTLYQTLFRSMGWLSRPDLLTRKAGDAGPSLATPGAQMPGEWTFHYSVVPHCGSWEEAAIWQAGQSFTSPLAARLCDSGEGSLPQELSFLSIEPESLLISAIKRSVSGQGIIVRFYNPTSSSVRGTLQSCRPLAGAHLVRLDETKLKPVKVSRGNRVSVSVKSREIVTLELELGE